MAYKDLVYFNYYMGVEENLLTYLGYQL